MKKFSAQLVTQKLCKRLIKICLITLFIVLVRHSYCQSINYKKYELGNDLDCKSIFSLYEDSNGYLWVGTDDGVLKHDGATFKHFDIHDGMSVRSIYQIGELTDGTIWFVSNNNITFFDGKKMKPFELNWLLEKKYRLKIKQIEGDSDSTFVLSTTTHGILKVADHSLNRYNRTSSIPYIGTETKEKQSYLRYEGISYPLKYYYSRKIPKLWISDSTLLFSIGKTLYKFNSKSLNVKQIWESDSEILSLAKDSKDIVWLTVHERGVFQYDDRSLSVSFFDFKFVKSYRPAQFFESRDGGYWMATIDDGLYYIPNLDIKTIDHQSINNVYVKKVISNRNTVFLGTSNAYIAEISNGKIREVDNFNCELRDLTFNTNGDLISSSRDHRFFNHRTLILMETSI